MALDAPPLENIPQRVLIIDTAWLGDVVFTTALIGAARQLWPTAQLHVLVAPRGEPILRGHAMIDRLWIYDKHGAQKSASSLLQMAATLRHERFDLILNAHPSFRSRLLTWLTRAPIRVGYKGFGSSFAFTHSVPNDLSVQPDHVQRRLALLLPPTSVGGQGGLANAGSSSLSVTILPEASEWADRFLLDNEITKLPLLAIIPGSAWETKRWPEQNFSDLSRHWVDRLGGDVLVFGGPSESDLVTSICETGPHRFLPVIGEPLPRVAALLARCSAVVGNDTGVTFLAVAAGAKEVVGLYGCTQADYTFPPPHQALTAGVPCCLPRTGHGSHRCKWASTPWCMSQISVERVWKAIA
jgi:heptosyltransferase II